jgi:hypothetical protein
MPSPLAFQARAQSHSVCQQLQQYRSGLPFNVSPRSHDDLCRRDGWVIGRDFLNGEFDIDPVFAQQLLCNLCTSPDHANVGWISEYTQEAQPQGTLARLYQESQTALIGRDSLLSNVNTGLGAAHAAHAGQVNKAIQAGAQKVVSGAQQSVRINAYITVYNANTTGKGRPRPKLRIQNMPLQVVQPAVSPQAKYNTRSQTTTEALKNAKTRDLAMRTSSLRRVYLAGKLGTGVITFAPSLVMDLYENISRDTNGALKFDSHQFALASARSQSTNAVGLAGGMFFGAVAAAFGAAGLPVIVVGFIGGIIFQVGYGRLGGPDDAEAAVKKFLDR